MSKEWPAPEPGTPSGTADDHDWVMEPALAQFLELVADNLRDEVDHPEIWQVLYQLAQQDDASVMIYQIDRVRPFQLNPFVGKVLDIVSGVMTAVAVDRVAGMAKLKQLDATHSLCPQVAGACYFVSRLDTEDQGDLSAKFCENPFNRFDTLVDGTVATCCSIWTRKRIGKLDTQTVDEIWNGIDAQEMRESILDGSFRYCNKQRCTRITKDQLPNRDDVTDPHLRAVIDGHQTQLDVQPINLALAHDTTCNLACPSCRSGMLVATAQQEARFDKILRDVFHPMLQTGKDMNLFLSGQGDPWSSHHYRSILRYVADHDLPLGTLAINTNALLMGPKRWEEFQGLEKYRPSVRVSVDACTPWVYEEVRKPGKFEKLYENLQFIAGKHREGIFSFFNINATIQLDNYHELPALVDFAEHLGCVDILFYMIQNTGGHLALTFEQKNIGDAGHPLHTAFLETLRDPKLDRPIVNMYDVAILRDLSFGTHLPSDDLGPDFALDDVQHAIGSAMAAEDHRRTVALCAAGRIRFPEEESLLRTEAMALTALGFQQQAGYRLHMASELAAAAAAIGAC